MSIYYIIVFKNTGTYLRIIKIYLIINKKITLIWLIIFILMIKVNAAQNRFKNLCPSENNKLNMFYLKNWCL